MNMFKCKSVVRTRLSRLLIIRCLCAILLLLLVRQIALHSMLSAAPQEKRPDLVRGTHSDDREHYTPNRGSFMCLTSMEQISFDKVNDNYCDCLDSTDEPGTNACPDGTFHCAQISLSGNHPKAVHSSKVNDGICDCCDGSDEYEGKVTITSFDRQQQTESKHFLVPCVNVC